MVHILRQVCAGLAEAHGKGLVHRDISMTNIMACLYGGEYDFVKILDFGLVKNIAGGDDQTITRTLRILGTPLYMAPERLRDPADVDARADIYALGAVAFFVLTGRRMDEYAQDVQAYRQSSGSDRSTLGDVFRAAQQAAEKENEEE